MKTIQILLINLILASALFSQELTVDKNRSSVKWKGTKIGGFHKGTIPLKSGTVTLKDGDLSKGNFVIDMTGIKVVGSESADDKKDIVKDITAKPFFNTANYKTATFQISKANKITGNENKATYKITGLLTIKGLSHTVSFPAIIQKKEDSYRGTATIKFNRQKWNLGFSGISGFMKERVLKDMIEIDVNIIAK